MFLSNMKNHNTSDCILLYMWHVLHPKNNSVVIKMNKPSPGFFKRHGLVGVINGNEGPTAGNTECAICVLNGWMHVIGLYV